jgi:hypothetical protein
MLSLLGLGSVGLCLAPLRKFLRVGGRRVDREARLFGKWSRIVFCGAFGRSRTIDASRTRRGLERSSSIFFLLLFILGLQAGSSRELLAL